MPCDHEFGIIDAFDRQTEYSVYEPHQYNCISVDDDVINNLIPHLTIMKTYFHSINRPAYGLAHWGISIIPPESLPLFYDVITTSRLFKKSIELNELALKIAEARESNKYMIHFGI
ncbi:short-chain dehydrogenase [Bacillus sp. HMF5848]|uniref:short-chain dehydrogenase n=1 Tax=Bacillus sp. HMF5848 TaxID=2495421 RepID=UPI000F7B00C6|nr:short-chain dehydrogenase [Bacillus sp. HMF5848]RSK26036.1 short-chain dehydrogenase [Bacillus sp. HMF5848]